MTRNVPKWLLFELLIGKRVAVPLTVRLVGENGDEYRGAGYQPIDLMPGNFALSDLSATHEAVTFTFSGEGPDVHRWALMAGEVVIVDGEFLPPFEPKRAGDFLETEPIELT